MPSGLFALLLVATSDAVAGPIFYIDNITHQQYFTAVSYRGLVWTPLVGTGTYLVEKWEDVLWGLTRFDTYTPVTPTAPGPDYYVGYGQVTGPDAYYYSNGLQTNRLFATVAHYGDLPAQWNRLDAPQQAQITQVTWRWYRRGDDSDPPPPPDPRLPEPGTLAGIGCGLMGIGMWRRWRG